MIEGRGPDEKSEMHKNVQIPPTMTNGQPLSIHATVYVKYTYYATDTDTYFVYCRFLEFALQYTHNYVT